MNRRFLQGGFLLVATAASIHTAQADTVASTAGAIAGALRGVEAIEPDWIEKIRQYSKRDQTHLLDPRLTGPHGGFAEVVDAW
jgi:hypothetical protein